MKLSFSSHKLYIYWHSIRARILLSTLSLIILVGIVITLISHSLVSEYVLQTMIQTSESKLSLLSVSVDSSIKSVTGFVHSCKTNSKIRDFAMEDTPANSTIKREAKEFISETYTANTSLPAQLIRFVVIVNDSDEILQLVESTYSSVSVSAEAINALPYVKTLKETPGSTSIGIVNDPFITTRKIPMLPFVTPIQHPHKADEIGYIFVEMSPTVITAPLKSSLSGTDSTLFVKIGNYDYQYVNNELVPYSGQFTLLEDLSGFGLDQNTIVQKVEKPDASGNAFLISRAISDTGWYVTECLDEDLLERNILNSFRLIMLTVILSAIIVAFLFSWFLNQAIYIPVKKLQKRMKRIAQGDFSRDPSTEWNHELGEIGKNINDLSENVLSLMNQELENERLKRDYEYQMLQSQINPHFLYNTLNSIKWMATIQNSPGIAEMTTALSRLLKDISKGTTNIVPIKHELTLIKDYYTIQKYRYGGTITLTINVDDDSLLECSILKFTLQPIVENAIFHGIEPKLSAGTITIHIYQDDACNVHIDVTDDGVGMEKEVASKLLDSNFSTSSSFFKQIGICNVHKRLQYEYGEQYGLSVDSELGKYTTVSILLPFERGTEKND